MTLRDLLQELLSEQQDDLCRLIMKVGEMKETHTPSSSQLAEKEGQLVASERAVRRILGCISELSIGGTGILDQTAL